MIGFDIGGTKCSVSIGVERNGQLEILCKQVIPTDRTVSPLVMVDRMCVLAENMSGQLQQTGKEHAENIWDAIGISCGGPLDSKRGVILSPPNLPGWDEVPIVAYLQQKYHTKVSLQNDANACAVAEWRYGAGKSCRNMIFLTFGTGMVLWA